EGIVLKNQIATESIITDSRVTSFNNNVAENPPNQFDLNDSQKVFQLNMIAELINYYQFMFPINRLIEIYNRNISSFKGNIINPLTEIKEVGVQPILVIANSFNNQLKNLCEDVILPENNTLVLERIHKAITYFINHTKDKIKAPFEGLTFSTEDKALQKDFDKNLNTIEEYINVKLFCLYGLNGSFTIKKYLKLRAEAVLLNTAQPKKTKEFKAETEHPKLFEMLRNLRDVVSNSEDIPHFQVFTQHTLYEMCDVLPLNKKQLKAIHGMGKIRVEKYGKEILAIINEYADENNIIVKEKIVEGKPKKEKTKLTSLKMFKGGLSIAEIATQRELVVGTIESHLASYIATGEIDMYDLITEDRFLALKKQVENLKFENLTDLKNKLKDTYSYFELRIVANELSK
ncbi:MAG: valyl-tRNA synthetase, partial [bacterium]